MRIWLLILALVLPAIAYGDDPVFGGDDEVAQQPAVDPISDLDRRVTALEESQLTREDVEEIAETVFKRMFVVNKADGSQELREIEGKFSDGSTVRTTLGPGESFATAVNPATGERITLGQPAAVAAAGNLAPATVWESESIRIIQSPPLADGSSTLDFQQCQIINGKKVCGPEATSARASSVQTFKARTVSGSRPIFRPFRR